ncbi:efflux RND transporter periplasmic adaptor subunit [Acidithrix sp. C25]|uniref:efflux RND transporter periplasmic adaptor subunit n=1 Tax=Acidithrix sp. C25 TaxID=1671482 RepID=UPI00191B9608|nr:efflux RND transporter periplasmic adaptor subunit [Acidithrix sp. C25]CAG4909380.1 unnamed protein product [Acidithrix sp. C25]
MEQGRGSRNRRTTTFAVFIIILVASNSLTWYLTKRTKSASASAVPTIKRSTVLQSVTSGTISRTIATTGTVEPGNSANVNFAVSGIVNAVNVTVGQNVTAGQTLASVDSTTLAATLNLDQANLANDQAVLASDEASSASTQQIASDNATIASATTQVSNAQTALNDANLTAPIAGTVTAVNLAVGQQVTGSGTSVTNAKGTVAGSTAVASTTQISIIALNSYTISATVTSAQVGKLQDGEQATITIPGQTGTDYGVVTSVGLVASTTSGVSSFPVTISVTGAPKGLYVGLSANVSIFTQVVSNAILVPSTALSVSGSQETVTLDQNGNKVPTVVTTGISSGGQTQITSGITTGQKIFVTKLTINGVAIGGGRVRRAFGGGGGLGGGGFGGGLG